MSQKIRNEAVLPNFLGIGAQRAGTSWMAAILSKHPDIYLPPQRKEIHYFNDNYHHGIEWYLKYFPNKLEAEKYKIIGEYTPGYMFDFQAPHRIFRLIPDCKLLVMLRNPADRAISAYKRIVRNENYQHTFWDCVKIFPDILERGMYANQILNVLKFFNKDSIHVIISEQIWANYSLYVKDLANFLSVSSTGFESAECEKINRSYIPALPGLYASAVKVRKFLRGKSLDYIVQLFYKHNLDKMFKRKSVNERSIHVDPGVKQSLIELFEDDILSLEKIINKDLSFWFME